MTGILETVREPLLLATAVATGLQAGTYYTWASGVMPGLSRVTDRTFVEVMQQVNRAIVNPVFLASFLGAPLLAVAASVTVEGPARPWAVASAVLAVATVLITAVGNIPLNNRLEAAGPVTDAHAVRRQFESAWVRWNALRALTSTAALAAVAWATLQA
ncbi:DUF1772 domain-containing protein [Nocardioides sp. SYSU DS0651]|uniref:anthrone oxygenase family protein n=1 Tax=Nocardioides sp. SYSU DS0651 TaxID=3415955 RepID=UPI003F4BE7E3